MTKKSAINYARQLLGVDTISRQLSSHANAEDLRVTIWHVPCTRSVRVLWICEELSIPYSLLKAPWPVDDNYAKNVNPIGKVPAVDIKTGSTSIRISESGAICEWLIHDHQRKHCNSCFRPPLGTVEHANYLQWMWFAEATMARPIGEIVNHRRAFLDNAQEPIMEEMRLRVKKCVGVIEKHLSEHQTAYIIGNDFTVADIMLGYSLFLSNWLTPDSCGLLPTVYPNVARYWCDLQRRAAFKRAFADTLDGPIPYPPDRISI